MKRMLILLAAGTMVVAASGCGCCNWCLPKPQTFAAAYPPPAAPACNPCDPCATGQPVTYGYAPATTTYAPAPSW
jgi:hypothetical protein